jgi:TonB family protein
MSGFSDMGFHQYTRTKSRSVSAMPYSCLYAQFVEQAVCRSNRASDSPAHTSSDRATNTPADRQRFPSRQPNSHKPTHARRPVHIGGSVKPPKVIHSVKPEVTEEARRANFHGTVRIYCWIDEQGNPLHIRIVHSAGLGLDETAVDAVRQYKFKPATRDGKPVKVDINIDVNFKIN